MDRLAFVRAATFDMRVKFLCALVLFAVTLPVFAREQPQPELLKKIKPLPVALNPDFQFRKTKLYFLSEHRKATGGKYSGGSSGGSTGSKSGGGDGQSSAVARSKSTSTAQEASINFERNYRLYGAVTRLDQRQLFGDYLNFFWRTKRPADVTVRLEYQQEKLHAHIQAQEISYHDVNGSRTSEFKVIGDDYYDNGRIIAWRCILIVDGKIVAEDHSYMWRG